jgi:hypothetical protein
MVRAHPAEGELSVVESVLPGARPPAVLLRDIA